MLDYYVAVRRATGEHVRQNLLYVGRALASDDWADNEWALLTKTDPEKVIRIVFERVRALSGQEQEAAATTFVILSGIMGTEGEVERRFTTDMIDLMENKILGPAIRKGLEQGREESRELFQGILEDRFGKMPPWAESKLAAANPETLKAWSHRILRAATLEELLA